MHFLSLPFFFFFFLWPHMWCMEVPRLGVLSKLQLTPMPQSLQYQIWATFETYTAAYSNRGSLTHWARPGIKPATSCMVPSRIHQPLHHDGNSRKLSMGPYTQKGVCPTKSNPWLVTIRSSCLLYFVSLCWNTLNKCLLLYFLIIDVFSFFLF